MRLQSAKNTRSLVGGVLVALLAVLIFVSLAGQSDATDTPNALDQFSVLDSADGQSLESMPSEVQDRVARLSYSPEFAGLSPSKVGLAAPDGRQVAVTLIGGILCAQVIEDGLGTCAEPSVAVSGGTFAASPVGCDAYSVVGLMPDGVESLLVDQRNDGSIESEIDVDSNVYLAELSPVSTMLRSQDGRIQVELPLQWYASDNDACQKVQGA